MSRLIDAFNTLPGVGPKSAQRLAYHLLRMPEDHARALAEAILDMKARSILCERCQNITEMSPCAICQDATREQHTICVVEEPLDLVALERGRGYKGQYHVLHGVISPMDGIGPEQLKVRELLNRLRDDTVREVIMATNPTLEGEATAMYLQRLIAPLGIRVTRLARGLPAGADLEYADDVTLARAMEGRQEVTS